MPTVDVTEAYGEDWMSHCRGCHALEKCHGEYFCEYDWQCPYPGREYEEEALYDNDDDYIPF